MSTWTLFFLVSGYYGVWMSTFPGFTTQDACRLQAVQITEQARPNMGSRRIQTMCVEVK